MYARCTTMQGAPETVDEAIRYTQEKIVPIGREIPGFQGLLAFVDRDSGKGMTITLWDSEEARAESAARANQVRSEASQALGGEILAVEDYELAIEER